MSGESNCEVNSITCINNDSQSCYKSIINPTVLMDHDSMNYYIQVELPGVEREDIDLEVSEQGLWIKGSRDDLDLGGCYSLIPPVDANRAEAKFENGLLNIIIPLKRSHLIERVNIQ
ncbi:MAG: Hsp20/alpha crystallin family protein [Promethearchaeota archaeon]